MRELSICNHDGIVLTGQQDGYRVAQCMECGMYWRFKDGNIEVLQEANEPGLTGSQHLPRQVKMLIFVKNTLNA